MYCSFLLERVCLGQTPLVQEGTVQRSVRLMQGIIFSGGTEPGTGDLPRSSGILFGWVFGAFWRFVFFPSAVPH